MDLGLEELKLASERASIACDEEDGNYAAITVATVVRVPEKASSACVPCVLELMHNTTDEDIDPARLVNWLRTHTKPNFTKKEGSSE